MRLYAPALVLVFWSVVIAACGLGDEMAGVAMGTLALALIWHAPAQVRRWRR